MSEQADPLSVAAERCSLYVYEEMDDEATHQGRVGCQWCGKQLPPGRRRWCSNACSKANTDNHRWTQARRACRRRNYKRGKGWRCNHCGDFFSEIEVNHIIPCKGRHSQWGCWHHQDNLETLCHGCHVAATAEQRRGGLL